MRVPLFSAGDAARGAGLIAVTVIGIAAFIHAARHEPAPAEKDASGANSTDPIAAALIRCQNIGLPAQDDGSCLATWAENRRRFFGDEHPVVVGAHAADSPSSQQPGR